MPRDRRKVYRLRRDPGLHEAAAHYAQAFYNLCRAHRGWRLRIGRRRWRQSCPAAAQDLTGHDGSVRE